MPENQKSSAFKVAIGGLLLALTIIFIYLESVLPTGRLSLYALSSFTVSIIIIEFRAGFGWVFYTAACLLSLIVVPDKISVVPYAAFFGVYGIIKYYIETIRGKWIGWIFKLVFFNIALTAAILFLKEFLLQKLGFSVKLWLAVILLEVVFVIYDIVYSSFIRLYKTRFGRNITR